jgi:hypothetical protein
VTHHLDAYDDDCDQPIEAAPPDALTLAWRRHTLAQVRLLSGLVTVPSAELERRESDADDACRRLRALGGRP